MITSGWSPGRRFLSGIFIPSRTGTEARASDMAECGKGNCVQRSPLRPAEERRKGVEDEVSELGKGKLQVDGMGRTGK